MLAKTGAHNTLSAPICAKPTATSAAAVNNHCLAAKVIRDLGKCNKRKHKRSRHEVMSEPEGRGVVNGRTVELLTR